MAADLTPPDGFVLDSTPAPASPPDGFVLDSGAPAPSPLAQLQPKSFGFSDIGEAQQPDIRSPAELADMTAVTASNAIPYAQLAGGIAGLGTAAAHMLGLTDKTGADVAEDVTQAAQYQPRTEAGKKTEDTIQGMMEPIAKAGKWVGDTAQDYGAPAWLSAGLDTATQALPFMALDAGARGGVRALRSEVPHVDADIPAAAIDAPLKEADKAVADLTGTSTSDTPQPNPRQSQEYSLNQQFLRDEGGQGYDINAPDTKVDLKDHGFSDPEIADMADKGMAHPDGTMDREQFWNWKNDTPADAPPDTPVRDIQSITPGVAEDLKARGYSDASIAGMDVSDAREILGVKEPDPVSPDETPPPGVTNHADPSQAESLPAAETGTGEPVTAGGSLPAEEVAGGRSDAAAPAPDAQGARPGEAPQGVGTRNAAIDQERLQRGLEAIPAPERREWSKPLGEALQRIQADPEYAPTLAKEVAARPRQLTDTETLALGEHLRDLNTRESVANADILKARADGDTIAEAQATHRLQSIHDQMETNHAALRAGGTHNARALAVRNAIVADDYSIGRNMDRAKVAYGDHINDALKQHVQDLTGKLKDSEARYQQAMKDAETAKKAPNQTAKKAVSPDEKMQMAIQRQMDKLQADIQRRLKACPV